MENNRKLVHYVVPIWRKGGGSLKTGIELERNETTVTVRDLVRTRTTFKVPVADVTPAEPQNRGPQAPSPACVEAA